MHALARIYQILDMAGCPRCTKALIVAVHRAHLNGSRVKMSAHSFKNGTDARHASEQGLLHQLKDGTLVLTKKARSLLQ
jgi:hypothetical protein